MRVTAIGSPADREGGNAGERNINTPGDREGSNAAQWNIDTPARQTQEHPDKQICVPEGCVTAGGFLGFRVSWPNTSLSTRPPRRSEITPS
mmetsp:Transcript_6885/g.16680  ORF Transcript_6885/g.16680 Transcript_6885/m.16680 type:complete len:91 (-) Transcript_6885:156-428(-)